MLSATRKKKINVGIPETVLVLKLPSKNKISRKCVVHFFF